MDIINDKGRLFGTVNIIDALVVLLVLAVAAAGTAFVLQFDTGNPPPENSATPDEQNTTPATRYATINLRVHPAHVAAQITKGDNGTLTGDSFTITDVYRTPHKKGVHVWARIELNGQAIEKQNAIEFTFAKKHLQSGTKLHIETDQYQFNGTVRTIDNQNPALRGGTTNVVLQTITPTEKATTIQPNDIFAVANGTVAVIKSVDVYPTGKAHKKRVVLGVSLDTLNLNDQRLFINRPVRIGQKIPFRTDTYSITTRIIHRGNTTLPGERTTTNVTLKLSDVEPEIADGIATGMAERDQGTTRARIVDKRVENATVVLKSENGTIHEREHPTKKDVYLTVELQTRRTDAGLYFHGRQLQEGNQIVLDLGSITVRGQAIDLKPEE